MKIPFDKFRHGIMITLLVICSLCALIQLKGIFLFSPPEMQYLADNCYDKTLTVIAREDFAPYSFIDENGNLAGYNVELINLIANKLQMNVDMTLAPQDECIDQLKSGTIDIACNTNYSADFKDMCLLSSPIGRHRVVIFGLHHFETFHDLFEKKIATVARSPVISDLHTQLGFTRLVEYQTYADALDAVMCGEVDYIIGAYAILDYRTNTMGYSEINAVSSVISTEGFALGITNNNVELQLKVNNALAELNNEGLYAEISTKWLGAHTEAATDADIIRQNMPHIIISYTLLMMFLFYFLIVPLHHKSQRDRATKLYDKVTTKKLIKRKLSFDGALFVIDINCFKEVNDTYGHATGDAVIHDVAEALRHATRSGDVLGRIGGDEFVAYLPSMKCKEDALHKAVQLQAEIRRRTATNPNGTESNVSIGIAFNQNKTPYDELFSKADKALYTAKKLDSRIAIYTDNHSS